MKKRVGRMAAEFEDRKLWLLNGAHSLPAYAGSARGHGAGAEAVTDATCRQWVEVAAAAQPGGR